MCSCSCSLNSQWPSCRPLGSGQWTPIICGWKWICKFHVCHFSADLLNEVIPRVIISVLHLDLQHDECCGRRILCISGENFFFTDNCQSMKFTVFYNMAVQWINLDILFDSFDRKKQWMRLGGGLKMSSHSRLSTKRKRLWALPLSSTERMANHSTRMMNKLQRYEKIYLF